MNWIAGISKLIIFEISEKYFIKRVLIKNFLGVFERFSKRASSKHRTRTQTLDFEKKRTP